MPIEATVAVYGVDDALKELKALDAEMYWASVSKIKRAAEPMRQAIAGSIPSQPPMSGWGKGGRTGWRPATTKVTTQYGKRYDRGSRTRTIVRVVLSGASASIYDLAAKSRSGSQGQQFVENLNRRGKASRAAWPVANRMLPQINRAVVQAAEEVMRSLNKRLVTKPTGR